MGAASATAFGDYVAGSNHVLPTGGAARFASGLSARHFRRRMQEVRIGDVTASARKLAAAGAPIARAEGFEVHAESMEARTLDSAGPTRLQTTPKLATTLTQGNRHGRDQRHSRSSGRPARPTCV